MSSVFPLSNLGFDVVNLILGQVSLHSDPISFAASSRACHELVVPRHSEYRILQIRDLRPQVWAHLARRPDLARHIREVCWQSWSSMPERYPSTLLDTTTEVHPETIVADICKALRSMENLQSFTWSKADSRIYQTLQRFPSLFRLCIHRDGRGDHALGPPEAQDADYPLWHISYLKDLSVNQRWWPERLQELLLRSPNLRSALFDQTHFPHLKRVELLAEAAAERTVVKFLQRHPTIEDLQWSPHNKLLYLGPGSLPRLRRLTANPEFTNAVLSDLTVPDCAIECVGQLSLDKTTWPILTTMNIARLQELQVWRYDNLKAIHRLVELAPQLRRLEIPGFSLATRDDADAKYTVDDYIEVVYRFPCLEFLDSSLWLILGGSKKIKALASRPKLQRLGHVKAVMQDYVEIELTRKGEEVIWKEETVPY